MHSRSGSSTLRARAAAFGLGLAVAATSATVVAQAPAAQALSPVDVTLIGINDFHGRLLAARDAGGAAKLATAVDSIRAEYGEENTIFAAAGDLIGASTFESFIQQDKPTIDVLNAAGLDVSAVGNHEFDQGYDDLVDRVMSPFDAETNPRGGAEWTYIGANVKMKDSGEDALEPTYVQTIGEGDSAVEVGFIGAVTEHLPELVSPAGIADLEVTDIVEAVNTEADALEAEGVDLIVMLVHEGAPTTDCTAIGNLADDTDFGSIVQGVDSSVHAIISGHTHLAYDCLIAPADAPLQPRPVVSAGQYGLNINRLTFTVDADGQADPFLKVGDGSEIIDVARTEDPFAEDPEVKAIVDAAAADSDELGAEPLGEIAGPFTRAKAGNGTSENRGGESTVGNLVAEAQRWAADSEIGFINPGGLRADMLGENAEGYPAVLTYKQAAVVQPFANTLVKMDLTGEQLKSVLEEQWQPEGSSRPILHLGVSDGFEWSYDPTAAAGEHVTGMWLDEEPIEMEETYSVVANSFLASGGDNFFTLAEGSDPTDTGYADLQAMVDFMDEFASTET
ncbi:MAG: bifunctional UDP-sugar hydrolase/5'-nucleotidase [Actinomycetota bacterium]|nr:bifunctional UDP-sugar hydrolase/5'-nucleotidase [Actinomycetota bacterium]